MVQQMSVDELKKKMDEGKKPYLLDIREPFERDIAALKDDKHIPMREIPQRLAELDKSQEIVVYCRSGSRSLQVCNYLVTQGFSNVHNLKGGVLAWADFIDPSMQKY